MSEEKGSTELVEVQNMPQVSSFEMTIDQAEQQIEKSLKMYELTSRVIAKLLDEKNRKDMYYMGELGGGKKKDDELPVINKQGTDKLIAFFKLKTTPEVTKIDGGYSVTVVGHDNVGNYITTGTGICTKHEKKYMWIKADDEDYKAANEEDRREITRRKRNGGSWQVKQIRTDERSIAHTLVSMAEKRARAAFLRKALPGLNDVSFEGEEPQVDYENTPPPNQMPEKDITAWAKTLKKSFTPEQIDEALNQIKGDKKLKGMTLDIKDAINTYLQDNFGGHQNA